MASQRLWNLNNVENIQVEKDFNEETSIKTEKNNIKFSQKCTVYLRHVGLLSQKQW